MENLYLSACFIDECTFPFHQLPHSSPTSQPQSLIPSSSIPSTLTFTSIPTISTPLTLSAASSPPYQHVSQLAPQFNPTPSPTPSLDSLPTDPSPLSLNIHPMQTRSQSGIYKPKAITATKHPLPFLLSPVYPQLISRPPNINIGAMQCRRNLMLSSTLAHGLLSLNIHLITL